VPVEALLFLLLVGREFLLIAALLELQPLTLALLVGAESGPVLLPPGLVEVILIELRRRFCRPGQRRSS
jgi:hypothetical protein